MEKLDSPKCKACFFQGRLGQTYKVAGKPYFKCHDCGTLYTSDSFSPEEFKWKSEPDIWKVKMDTLNPETIMKEQAEAVIAEKTKNVS